MNMLPVQCGRQLLAHRAISLRHSSLSAFGAEPTWQDLLLGSSRSKMTHSSASPPPIDAVREVRFTLDFDRYL